MNTAPGNPLDGDTADRVVWFISQMRERAKMVSPGEESSSPGLSCDSAKGLISRILFYAVIPLGGALPLALISDLPGGFGNCLSRLGVPGRYAAQAWLLARASLPIWSCSVWGLPCLRHCCRSGALLPHLFTLTSAWGRPLDESIGCSGSSLRRGVGTGGIFSVALAVHGP